MKKILLVFVFCFSLGQMAAQNTSLWHAKDASRISELKRNRINNVCEGELYFSLNLNAFKQTLTNANDKFSHLPGVVVSIPNLNGEIETYQVWENSNFEPVLQARFPELRSYVGKGITDKYATLNLSISPAGIQTMVFRANNGTEFIEGYDKEATTYVLFNSSKRLSGRLPFNCSTNDVALANDVSGKITNTTLADNAKYKTFRLALSCTGEYANFFGATSSANVALVLAAMNATMTRVNGVMEKDLAVHLNMIANDAVIYYDGTSDPYSDSATGATGTWNGELMNNLHTTLGDSAFDIGHLFGADGGGGNAGCIGCVCNNTLATGGGATAAYKGAGFTSPADAVPQGDSFDIDYVVHEMGHQLGANHTFTYNFEGSGAQVEPGSGSSIMAYAGVATTTAGASAFNVQAHSDALYCYKSINQIQTNLNASNASCAVTTVLAGVNATPTITVPSAYTIPVGTAFKLTATAADADAGDALTYSWEQNNLGTSATTQANSRVLGTKTVGPNFKIFPASSSPTRYFPQWSKILAGNLVVTAASDLNWESLSSVARALNFTCTVRDNHSGMGQTKTAACAITVVDGGGAFAITSPNTADVAWNLGSSQTITWSVAGTTANGINTANVNILMSTDGGNTFPIVLASNTANDGSETVTMPGSNPSATCRIMVEAVGNVFFAVSKNVSLGYTITNACNTYSYTTATPFVDQAPGTYTTRTLSVPTGGTISDVNVFNKITHTYLSDVQTDISSPQNPTTFIKLFNRSCGSTNGAVNLKFSDDGGAINCTAGGTTLQTVAPGEALSAFNGQNPQGTWTFRVYDNYTGDTGTINNWGIEICTQTLTLNTPENQLTDFDIYPNPNRGNFNIQFDNTTTNEIKVSVFDMRGRVIFENRYSNQATFNENIQLSNAQTGVYLVSVTDGNQKIVKRIVIE